MTGLGTADGRLAGGAQAGKQDVAGTEGGSVTVAAYPHSAWPTLAPIWSSLASQTARPSFFLTPEWTETWLEVFGDRLRPQILVFRDDGEPVGACLLVRRRERRGPVSVRRIYLNTAGEDEQDSPCLEFNTLLARDGWEASTARALSAHLDRERWDEFAVPAMAPGPAQEAIAAAFSRHGVRHTATPSHFVDLRTIRANGGAYEDTLPHKVRKQLRQYVGKYSELGTVGVQVPADRSDAFSLLARLAELHRQAWNARGLPGAFASPLFTAFHRSLIERTFDAGAVQLLRVHAGEEDVAVLYNFVHRGKAYAYQWGLQFREDTRFKPGFVAQVMAIRHALETGLDEYDLMAGDQKFKQELAPDARALTWMVFERRTARMLAVNGLRALRDRYHGAAPPPAEA